MMWVTRSRWQATRAAMLCVCVVSGCSYLPRIDPTGEHIFVPAERRTGEEQPAGQAPWDPIELILTPRLTVAPIGSEVIVKAGVRGADNYLRTNERVEWQIAPGGVGEFLEFAPSEWWDWLVCDFTRPRKITPTYAVTSTSRRIVQLTRGTPTPSDDVTVLRGETWVSVVSPVEGSSYITAVAPSVYGWDRRQQTATIHWIDAMWQFPPPSINPAGTRHLFTTTVMRRSDQSPVAGWKVKYTISGGPPAGFAPTGAPTIEVDTDAAGRANAEIVQTQPAPGTNTITIQVIRPTGPGGRGAQILVDTGRTSKTWSAPGLALRVTGPAVGSVGATLTYRLELSNPGDLPVEGIAVVDSLPEGLTFLNSTPAGQMAGRAVQWQVPRLSPRQCCTMELNVRAERVGSVSNCAEAVAGSLRAKECATTTISATPIGPPIAPTPAAPIPGRTVPGTGPARLDLKVRGPDHARVGETVTFELVITNVGQGTATDLKIKDRYDAGLEHEIRSPIQRPLGLDLPPGQTAQIGIVFRVARAGQLCHTVEVTGAGGLQAAQQSCLTATEAGGAPPGPAPKLPARPTRSLSLRVTTPNLPTLATVNQNEAVLFVVEVENTGTQPMTTIAVVATLDPGMTPKQATGGHRYDETRNTLMWTLPSLGAGERQTLQMEVTATQTAAQACNRVRVASQQGDEAQGKACVEVRGAASMAAGLKPAITSLSNPATAGQSFLYVIQVTNRGQAVENDVTVSVTLPADLSVVALGTYGPPQAQKYRMEGQTVRFDPLPRLFGGEPQTWHLRVLPKKAGEVQVEVQVTSRNTLQPILVRTRTAINPER